MKSFVCFIVFFVASCHGEETDATADEIVKPVKPLCPYCVESLKYSPVCCIYPDGSSMTFGSYCALNSYNCLYSRKCIAILQGSCECLQIQQYPPIDPYLILITRRLIGK